MEFFISYDCHFFYDVALYQAGKGFLFNFSLLLKVFEVYFRSRKLLLELSRNQLLLQQVMFQAGFREVLREGQVKWSLVWP